MCIMSPLYWILCNLVSFKIFIPSFIQESLSVKKYLRDKLDYLFLRVSKFVFNFANWLLLRNYQIQLNTNEKNFNLIF